MSIGLLSCPVFGQKLEFVRTQLGERYICAHKSLTTAYAKLGYNVSYFTMPSRRGLYESNIGRYDGEMLRVEGIEEEYKNLIPIPVAICYVQSVIVAKPHVLIDSYADFKKYRFGITSGYVGLERLVKQYDLQVTRAMKHDALLELLAKDRIDMAIINTANAESFVKSQPEGKFKINYSFARRIGLYHYLHKKHEKLVPLITQELEFISDLGYSTLPNTKK